MEPIMSVDVVVSGGEHGSIQGDLLSRSGIINGLQIPSDGSQRVTIKAEVPLRNMFGYISTLRELSHGKASFTMEFSKYAAVNNSVIETLKLKKNN
jgi:elongation factor G